MDTELVTRAQQGDETAFAELMEAVGGRLHRIAYSILRDRALAEDATQQGLLQMWRKLPGLRDPARFEAWSYRFVVHACHAEARKAKRTLPQLALGVLIVGGALRQAYQPGMASAEVWDPATASFAPAGSLHEARRHHTATLLPDGRVLLIAGKNNPGGTNLYEDPVFAEVWDPATASFSQAAAPANGRFGHTATLRPDGRALVIGGFDAAEGPDGALASTEIWNPDGG